MASGTDKLDRAARRALYRRMMAELRTAVRGASDDDVMRAIAARTATGSIAEILSAVPTSAGETEPWAEELLRGAVKKEALLAEAGGTFTTGQVAGLLGISVAAVQQRLRRRTLLALPLASGEWGFPVVQFTDAGVADGLPEVLRAFGGTDPWVQLSILLSDDYGPGRLIDWLREGRDAAEVLRIASGYGEQAAA
jgi:hypothetical protein